MANMSLEWKEYMESVIRESLHVKELVLSDEGLLGDIGKTAELMIAAYGSGKKVLIAGNGGSAADAQHIAGELVNKFNFDRPALPCISLSTDTSVMTAVSNDDNFENVFSRQIQALGQPGDLFIGISTSGNSANIIKALEECRVRKLVSIGMTGETGGRMKELCDVLIRVPSNKTPRIQEIHILSAHIICGLVEKELFGA
jgi:D-sedoheptulose 7-phosphate isomerase